MIDPTADEWTVAHRMRATELQDVANAYAVRGGVLRPDSDAMAREYFPAATPTIVRDLSRLAVGDVAQARAFTSRWGLLGYADLVATPPTAPGRLAPLVEVGDPIGWTWAHAHNFAIALALRRRADDDDDRLAAYLDGIQAPPRAPAMVREANGLIFAGAFDALADATPKLLRGRPDRHKKLRRFVVARPTGFGTLAVSTRMPIAKVASALVEAILNPHLRGMYDQVDMRASPPAWRRRFDSVLTVAYHHLAAAVLHERLLECDYCDAPFVPTHGHQRFCPREPWQEKGAESACALNYRTRKLRRKDAGS